MAKKTAKVIAPAAYQELLGWLDGKPSISKVKNPSTKKGTKKTKGNIKVDHVVITSSAKQKYYWIWNTKYFVKAKDVEVKK
jgi:hypothetical protein